MNEQMTLIDFADSKSREQLTPLVWGCMETCANCNCRFKDGTLDRFPGTGEPRCVNSSFTSKLKNNLWETRCKNYKWKDASHERK